MHGVTNTHTSGQTNHSRSNPLCTQGVMKYCDLPDPAEQNSNIISSGLKSLTLVTANLFKTLILPHLDYCSSVWDPYHTTVINKLESVQKFAAKLCTKHWSDTYSSLLDTLSWPTLQCRRSRQKVILCHRILRETSILNSSLNPNPNTRHHHLYQTLLILFARTLSPLFL